MSRAPTLLLTLLLLTLRLSASDGEATAQAGESAMLGHLEAFGRQGPSSSIDQVDGFLPPMEFLLNYAMQNRPILFKGAAKLSPAFHKWTDEYLGATVPPRPLGDVFIEHKKKENRSQSYSYVHFKKFLDIYNTSDVYMVSEVPQQLLKDLVLPFSLQCKFFIRGGIDTHVVWFSSGGTSSVIHHDGYENINCLYRGRKSLVFINTTRYSDQVEKIIDKVDGSYSSTDVDKIDLEARPEFRNLEFYRAEMEPGDCLYIPLLWVHQVRSFDHNLAVNLWWSPQPNYPTDLCMLKPSSKVTFDRVFFKSLEKTVISDVDFTRQIIKVNLPVNGRSEAALLKLFSGFKPELLASNKEFVTSVSAIFKSLDFDKNGELTDSELKMPLKRKQYRPVYEAIGYYNVLVFRMHESIGSDLLAADRLPKLLTMSNSDEGVFAPRRSWQQMKPAPEADDDEFDMSEMQAVTNAVGEDKQPTEAGGRQEDNKDEL